MSLITRSWRSSRRRRTAWAKRLGDIGVKHGISWLEYNPLVYIYYHEKAVADAPLVVESLVRLFPGAASYYDVGAGTGAYAAQAKRRGKRVLASEYSAYGRLAARLQGVSCTRFDLRKEPPANTRGIVFDLAYCFEVAEHVAPDLAERLVSHLVRSARTVVFTAAHPGQGGTGHINEQPKEYWIEQFENQGMRYRPDVAEQLSVRWRQARVQSWWLPENVMVFDRARSG